MWLHKKWGGGGVWGVTTFWKNSKIILRCLTDYLSQMWKLVITLLFQNISAGGAGGEGFFAGSRFGGFTKQMLLIWSILAGLWIHNNRFLHLRISKIVF